MRKIDAVLLSALIIYDYSAQSLADTDAVNLGHSFTAEYKQESNWMDAIGTNTKETIANSEEQVYRGVTRIIPREEVAAGNTISYHELASLPETVGTETVETVAAQPETISQSIQISVPDVAATEGVLDVPSEMTEQTTQIAAAPAMASVDVVENLTTDLSQLDSDNDGVFDYEDKCPGSVGVARFEGCPVPDSDNDGVNDEEDRCPYVAGSIENGGCAAVEEIQPNLEIPALASENMNEVASYQHLENFNFNEGALSNAEFNKLLQFADILVRNSDIKLEITYFTNKQENAQKIVAYLKDLGVDKNQVVVKANEAEQVTDLTDKINIQLLK